MVPQMEVMEQRNSRVSYQSANQFRKRMDIIMLQARKEYAPATARNGSDTIAMNPKVSAESRQRMRHRVPLVGSTEPRPAKIGTLSSSAPSAKAAPESSASPESPAPLAARRCRTSAPTDRKFPPSSSASAPSTAITASSSNSLPTSAVFLTAAAASMQSIEAGTLSPASTTV